MKKTYYFIISAIIVSLFFSNTVNAATTTVTTTGTAGTGETITLRGNNYSGLQPTYVTEGTPDAYTWEVNQNFQIYGLTKGKYYNGYFNITYEVTAEDPSNTLIQIEQQIPSLGTTNVTQGIYCYIYYYNGSYQVTVDFHNYYATETWIGLPTIKHIFTTHNAADPTYATPSINTTLTNLALGSNISNLKSTDTPLVLDLEGEILTVEQNILEYLQNRPVLQTTFAKSRIQLSAGNYVYRIDNNQRSVIISKDKNVNYVYINGFSTNNGNIFYFEEDPTANETGTIVNPTRVINLQSGIQYYPIDFAYNENYVFFNLGQATYNEGIFKAYIGEGYTYQALIYYINSILEMDPEQSSVAEEISSEYADRDNQSATLLSGMNSLSMPSISSGDLNIIGSLDTTQKTNFFGLIGTITHTEIVTKIMLIIVLGAIVGYILYGKK